MENKDILIENMQRTIIASISILLDDLLIRLNKENDSDNQLSNEKSILQMQASTISNDLKKILMLPAGSLVNNNKCSCSNTDSNVLKKDKTIHCINSRLKDKIKSGELGSNDTNNENNIVNIGVSGIEITENDVITDVISKDESNLKPPVNLSEYKSSKTKH